MRHLKTKGAASSLPKRSRLRGPRTATRHLRDGPDPRFLEMSSHGSYQKTCVFCKSGPGTNITTGALWSVDRMALCTPGCAGIKQGLLSQAPHRIPNTMEPRTSGLAVTSFLERGERSSCDAFPTKPTGTERRRHPVQQVRNSDTDVYAEP